jgi:hypothetical protein
MCELLTSVSGLEGVKVKRMQADEEEGGKIFEFVHLEKFSSNDVRWFEGFESDFVVKDYDDDIFETFFF